VHLEQHARIGASRVERVVDVERGLFDQVGRGALDGVFGATRSPNERMFQLR
jgi:hypothetical protein